MTNRSLVIGCEDLLLVEDQANPLAVMFRPIGGRERLFR
jgi:hypothetical protein